MPQVMLGHLLHPQVRRGFLLEHGWEAENAAAISYGRLQKVVTCPSSKPKPKKEGTLA